MALSGDQKALLRLLAQREEGYEDIASLTGSSVEEVRARVRDAVEALDAAGPSGDQKALLRLLAQREEGYEDIASLTGSSVEEVRARVAETVAGLQGGAIPAPESRPAARPEPEPEPKAEPGEAPEPESAPQPESGSARKAPATARPKAPARPAGRRAFPGLRLPEDRGALRGLLAGGAVVLVIVILLITGVLGGGDGGGSEAGSGGEGGSASNGGKAPTEAVLQAVGGGGGSGRALFGRSGQNVVLLLNAEGLPKEPKGQSYTVSLARSANQRLPIVATEATSAGKISGRFQVAPQILGLLAGGFDTMELALVPNGELRAALKKARNSRKAPNYGGRIVLEGPVTGPIVEAGEAESGG